MVHLFWLKATAPPQVQGLGFVVFFFFLIASVIAQRKINAIFSDNHRKLTHVKRRSPYKFFKDSGLVPVTSLHLRVSCSCGQQLIWNQTIFSAQHKRCKFGEVCSQSHCSCGAARAQAVLYSSTRSCSCCARDVLSGIAPVDYRTCQQNRRNFSASRSGSLEDPSHSPQ